MNSEILKEHLFKRVDSLAGMRTEYFPYKLTLHEPAWDQGESGTTLRFSLRKVSFENMD